MSRHLDPGIWGLKGQLTVQLVLGFVFMVITFVDVARGLVSLGVPESAAGSAALFFDMSVVGMLALVYAIVGRWNGCLGFLVLAAASIGIWGTYLTVAMRGGLKLSP